MVGRKLNIPDAVRILRSKGCSEQITQMNPLKRAVVIPPNAQKRIGIKSWGLIDYLRKEGYEILRSRR